MFKVRRIDNNKVYQVLDTYLDMNFQKTYFLIWDNGWCWRPAEKYVPPNYKEEEQDGKH